MTVLWPALQQTNTLSTWS